MFCIIYGMQTACIGLSGWERKCVRPYAWPSGYKTIYSEPVQLRLQLGPLTGVWINSGSRPILYVTIHFLKFKFIATFQFSIIEIHLLYILLIFLTLIFLEYFEEFPTYETEQDPKMNTDFWIWLQLRPKAADPNPDLTAQHWHVEPGKSEYRRWVSWKLVGWK